MEFNPNLVLSQCIKNPRFRDKVTPHLRPSWFEEDDAKELYKAIETLVKQDKVKVLDKPTLLLRFKDGDFVDKVLEQNFPVENTELLVKETEKWAQDQCLKEAIIKSADILNEKKDKGPVSVMVREALAFSFDKNLGLNYIKDIDRRFEFYNRLDEKISTGWDMLDVYTNGGFQKKSLIVGAGSSGLGKTLLGTNLTASLISRGYVGAYITLELAEEIISRRIDAVVCKLPYYALPNERERVERAVKGVTGNVFVREYPPSKASCQHLSTYIRELEIIEKVKMDFVIVDYIQLMKPNYPKNTNSYEKYKDIAEELREMAVELNIPVITFSQVQRAGYGNSDMGLANIADSIGIVNTADLVIGMTQTPDEEPEGFQTWKAIKNRLGRKGVSWRMQMDDEILAFNQILNEEERIRVQDFRDRMKKAPNIEVVKEDHEVTSEEEIADYVTFSKGEGKFSGFC